jgi:hypothetical protein
VSLHKHFIKDLVKCKVLQKCSKNGEDVILAGDFVNVISKYSCLSKMCRDLDLINAIHCCQGQPQDRFATWIGCYEILYYILVSRDLLSFINACGCEPFNAHLPGDHQGMFADFDTIALFRTPMSALAANAPHHI